jgi:hypothetical protein
MGTLRDPSHFSHPLSSLGTKKNFHEYCPKTPQTLALTRFFMNVMNVMKPAVVAERRPPTKRSLAKRVTMRPS